MVAVASKRALQLGIILLGTGLSVTTVLETGGQAFIAITLSALTTLAIVAALAHRFGIPSNLAVLIAAGTAICGATAIMALAPLVRARATEVSFAIAVITLFGTAAIAVYPLIGYALAMTEHAFGTWAGMAIHETAQVIAAAFQYGDAAGETATIVKLTRTTLLVPLAIALAALGVGPGDELITTPRIFIASASAAVMRGATPVLVDVDRDSGSLDVGAVAAAITPRAKAIVPVHLAG